MPTGIVRALRFLSDRLLMRRRPAAECAPSAPHDCAPETTTFVEIVAASTVLDFGDLPLEPRRPPRADSD
jgi:hypothetical protein